jgi:hypothetical protein
LATIYRALHRIRQLFPAYSSKASPKLVVQLSISSRVGEVQCVTQKCFLIVARRRYNVNFGLQFLYGHSCIEAVFLGEAGIIARAN